jgi:hypothetical protein
MELFRDENSGFFLTNIDPDISGLPMRIYTYPHLYTNSLPQQLQVPSILVSNWIGHRTAIWNDDNFMLSIENHLRLLEGRCKISRSDLNSVKEWSRLNRTVLIAN